MEGNSPPLLVVTLNQWEGAGMSSRLGLRGVGQGILGDLGKINDEA